MTTTTAQIPTLIPAIERDGWIVPAPATAGNPDAAREPVWGVAGGIAVGLAPLRGPRGLLRVYAPHIGLPPRRVINFIAVEPIVGGKRGLSELEFSQLDQTPGKRMWTTAEFDPAPKPAPPSQPAAPQFIRIDGAEALTFYVCVEPFANGARPIVQVILRKDRPHEVALRTFSADDGAAMQSCVLSATMGNYARLRRLWLEGEVIEAARLWPDFKPVNPQGGGFARPRTWGADRMARVGDDVIVAATSDEADAAAGPLADQAPPGWRYLGRPATQFWRARNAPGLVVRVNGRNTYWNSTNPIPGGIAYENFELISPFAAGQEFIFGATPKPPAELGPFRAEAGGATR